MVLLLLEYWDCMWVTINRRGFVPPNRQHLAAESDLLRMVNKQCLQKQCQHLLRIEMQQIWRQGE